MPFSRSTPDNVTMPQAVIQVVDLGNESFQVQCAYDV
ncbi:hypothetical protein JOE11_002005 [Robbsia andropogonis]